MKTTTSCRASHDVQQGTVNIKQRKLCDAFLLTGDIKKSAEIAGYVIKNNNISGPYKVLNSEKAKIYMKDKVNVVNETFKLGVEWKLKKLKNIVDAVVGDKPDEVDKRYASLAISSINEMNRIQGHHAPNSSIMINLETDEHIKRVNEITLQLLQDKKNYEI
jgi:hypothetical protein